MDDTRSAAEDVKQARFDSDFASGEKEVVDLFVQVVFGHAGCHLYDDAFAVIAFLDGIKEDDAWQEYDNKLEERQHADGLVIARYVRRGNVVQNDYEECSAGDEDGSDEGIDNQRGQALFARAQVESHKIVHEHASQRVEDDGVVVACDREVKGGRKKLVEARDNLVQYEPAEIKKREPNDFGCERIYEDVEQLYESMSGEFLHARII